MTTYRVLVAFESWRVGDLFTAEETIRLRMLVTIGYLRVVSDEATVAAVAATPRASRRRRVTE